jgi:(R,R)-butanediol dehydrogenase/meso-butanediol dehydrogenase/diacetyl reductase
MLMKAAVFQEVGKPLEVTQVPAPSPGAGEVIIKVGRCGICGSDLHLTEPGGFAPAKGSIIGHEIAGEVVELGKGVDRLKLGDRVAALPLLGCGSCPACVSGEPAWCVLGLSYLGGGYAQFARASQNECLVLPGQLSISDGALVEPLAVALHGIRMTPGISGASVLVLGAGPIGLGAIFWAARYGAARIDVVEGNEARGDLARAMGAHSVRKPVASANPLPLGADRMKAPEFVFECVGRPGLLTEAIARVRPRGTVVSLGFCMAPENLVAAAAAIKELTLKFPVLYSVRDYQMTLDAFESGALQPRAMITDTVGFDTLPQRFESLRKPSHQCKVMIDPWI